MNYLSEKKNMFFDQLKQEALNKLKDQIWCDLVIGRSDNNKVQWSDEKVEIYIQNIQDLLNKCAETIVKEEDLDDIPCDGIREYLYEICDTFYGIEDESDEFDEDNHDWTRTSPYK